VSTDRRGGIGALVPRPWTVVAVVLAAVGWELLALQFPSYRFPGLGTLAGNVLIVLRGTGEFDPVPTIAATLAGVGTGFVLSFLLALAWGTAMALRTAAEDYLSLPLFALLTVPSVVWAFLGVIWFGLTEHLVPVFVIVLVVAPYLAVVVWNGVEAVDDDLVEMARAFDASGTAQLRHVYLPQVLPALLAAVRLGLAVAWKLALVAEVFGAATGVGVAVKYYFESFETGMVIAWAVPVMALMVGVEYLLRHAEARATRWDGGPGASGAPGTDAGGPEVAPE
jgi:NitT/TauT family transport system permease protein